MQIHDNVEKTDWKIIAVDSDPQKKKERHRTQGSSTRGEHETRSLCEASLDDLGVDLSDSRLHTQ